MNLRARPFLLGILVLLLGGLFTNVARAQVPEPSLEDPQEPPSEKEAPYVPTPRHIVLRMLELADVSEDDVVYDLGSGDGRFIITAAKEFGARGVGIEIDPDLVKRAQMNAKQAGVADRVEFRRGDLFEADLSEATVVTLYLWPTMNNRLRPKLKDELDPGARVVSHDFGIDDWAEDTLVTLGSKDVTETADQIYLWTVSE